MVCRIYRFPFKALRPPLFHISACAAFLHTFCGQMIAKTMADLSVRDVFVFKGCLDDPARVCGFQACGVTLRKFRVPRQRGDFTQAGVT